MWPHGRRGRVLVIDDDRDLLDVLVATLGRDHDVIGLGSSREALARLLAGERYDAILCDMLMPELSGLELHASLLRSCPEQASRLVFMSGMGDRQVREVASGNVSVPCLLKPFDRETLQKTVQELIRGLMPS
jgi:CheY-like chemotaxis protein